MYIKLTKIESKNDNLRTKEIEGNAPYLPEIGLSFVMFAEPLTEGTHIRQVTTSVVESMNKISANKIRFKTMNSTYEIEILD